LLPVVLLTGRERTTEHLIATTSLQPHDRLVSRFPTVRPTRRTRATYYIVLRQSAEIAQEYEGFLPERRSPMDDCGCSPTRDLRDSLPRFLSLRATPAGTATRRTTPCDLRGSISVAYLPLPAWEIRLAEPFRGQQRVTRRIPMAPFTAERFPATSWPRWLRRSTEKAAARLRQPDSVGIRLEACLAGSAPSPSSRARQHFVLLPLGLDLRASSRSETLRARAPRRSRLPADTRKEPVLTAQHDRGEQSVRVFRRMRFFDREPRARQRGASHRSVPGDHCSTWG